MSTQTAATATRPLRIVQITDTHLYADSATTLLGMNTQQSLDSTLQLARAGHWPPDLILATGDLVHDGSEAGYLRLSEQLAGLGPTVSCLAGNHDDKANFGRLLPRAGVNTDAVIALRDWVLVMLDSSVPGEAGGRLSTAELRRLQQHLAANRQRHLLVCLHHQVVPVGSAWLDTMIVENAEELFDMLQAYTNVKGILSGHVHQEYDRMHQGLRVLTSPSTCIQFMPGSEQFALDSRNPGYRWLELHADGRIETGVQRVAHMPRTQDPQTTGY